ncbi:PREDICTED: uncharacterized protein LOC107350921 [Acropora digitifera]|uniref:uncharacterized protein LOC107350921 n=1 Tax=Acropora digitifera TaxID=70779 RepID=UPI00077AA32F|nr:PREDICTED: uncharacterized protein LOC107350921 [Acropora digitifera]
MGSLPYELQFLRGSRLSEDLESSESQALRKERQISRKILIFASSVALIGVICLAVGIALLGMNKTGNDNSTPATSEPVDSSRVGKDDRSVRKTGRNFTESCSYSTEFKKSGLADFIKKLKDTFYKLHPYELPYKPRVTSDDVRQNFEAFNPLPSSIKSISDTSEKRSLADFIKKLKDTFYKLHPYELPYKPKVTSDDVRQNFEAFNPLPSSIKSISDTSASLLQELNSLRINTEQLKAREEKAVAEMKHFLQHNFGNVYDYDYYSGQWMLGPNRFCHMGTIARLPYSFRFFLKRLAPSTVRDIEVIVEALKSFGRGISQYHQNVKLGVTTGMVGSIEECKVGFDCIKQIYPKMAESFQEGDVMMESFYYPLLTTAFVRQFQNVTELWFHKYGIPLDQSLAESLISFVGVPLANLLRYLAQDHMKHCVPSNVSSGLFNRPLSYVYYNGVPNKSEPTSKRLPTGEVIRAKAAYERTMRFFTTTNDDAESVHQLGWTLLKSLYPQAVDIAKSVANVENETEAVKTFRRLIKSPSMYFNEAPFPKNESDERAHRKCNSERAARKFCPVRYAALQRWFEFSRSTLSQLEPKLLQMFYWPRGPLKTTPVCPVAISANFMPTTSAQTYSSSFRTCMRPASFRIPFFLDRMGPKYSEWTTSAHEARPGHHLQSQGHLENFLDWCGPLVAPLARTRYISFSEGWALYAENPLISSDTAFKFAWCPKQLICMDSQHMT